MCSIHKDNLILKWDHLEIIKKELEIEVHKIDLLKDQTIWIGWILILEIEKMDLEEKIIERNEKIGLKILYLGMYENEI